MLFILILFLAPHNKKLSRCQCYRCRCTRCRARDDLFYWIGRELLLRKLEQGKQRLQIIAVDKFKGKNKKDYGLSLFGNDMPDLIVFNMARNKTTDELIRTLIHEIAHIIFDQIKSLKLPHDDIYLFEDIVFDCLNKKQKRKLLTFIPKKVITAQQLAGIIIK